MWHQENPSIRGSRYIVIFRNQGFKTMFIMWFLRPSSFVGIETLWVGKSAGCALKALYEAPEPPILSPLTHSSKQAGQMRPAQTVSSSQGPRIQAACRGPKRPQHHNVGSLRLAGLWCPYVRDLVTTLLGAAVSCRLQLFLRRGPWSLCQVLLFEGKAHAL